MPKAVRDSPLTENTKEDHRILFQLRQNFRAAQCRSPCQLFLAGSSCNETGFEVTTQGFYGEPL